MGLRVRYDLTEPSNARLMCLGIALVGMPVSIADMTTETLTWLGNMCWINIPLRESWNAAVEFKRARGGVAADF